ncbi:MAG: hypothetical protein ABFC78_02405 [Methanoregula sp.]
MQIGYWVSLLERLAIVAGIVFLVILIAAGLVAPFISGYLDMLARQNLINTSLVMITTLAIGALCASLFYFAWCYRT